MTPPTMVGGISFGKYTIRAEGDEESALKWHPLCS